MTVTTMENEDTEQQDDKEMTTMTKEPPPTPNLMGWSVGTITMRGSQAEQKRPKRH